MILLDMNVLIWLATRFAERVKKPESRSLRSPMLSIRIAGLFAIDLNWQQRNLHALSNFPPGPECRDTLRFEGQVTDCGSGRLGASRRAPSSGGRVNAGDMHALLPCTMQSHP